MSAMDNHWTSKEDQSKRQDFMKIEWDLTWTFYSWHQ